MRQKFFAFFLAFSLILSGCSQVSSSSSSQDSSSVTRTVTGKVKTVSGNELELAIGTLNTPPSDGSGQEEASGSDSGSSGRGSRPDSASQNSGGSNAPAGEMPSGGMGGPMGEMPSGEGFPGGEAGGMSPGAGSGRSSGSSITLTGEVETISIPVGTPVTMAGSTTTLDFSQIVVKNVITITYETGADGTEYLASITILS